MPEFLKLDDVRIIIIIIIIIIISYIDH